MFTAGLHASFAGDPDSLADGSASSAGVPDSSFADSSASFAGVPDFSFAGDPVACDGSVKFTPLHGVVVCTTKSWIRYSTEPVLNHAWYELPFHLRWVFLPCYDVGVHPLHIVRTVALQCHDNSMSSTRYLFYQCRLSVQRRFHWVELMYLIRRSTADSAARLIRYCRGDKVVVPRSLRIKSNQLSLLSKLQIWFQLVFLRLRVSSTVINIFNHGRNFLPSLRSLQRSPHIRSTQHAKKRLYSRGGGHAADIDHEFLQPFVAAQLPSGPEYTFKFVDHVSDSSLHKYPSISGYHHVRVPIPLLVNKLSVAAMSKIASIHNISLTQSRKKKDILACFSENHSCTECSYYTSVFQEKIVVSRLSEQERRSRIANRMAASRAKKSQAGVAFKTVSDASFPPPPPSKSFKVKLFMTFALMLIQVSSKKVVVPCVANSYH